MTDDSQTSTRNFIRGGQVLLHNYRMLKQLFDRIIAVAFIIFLSVTIGITTYRLNNLHWFSVKHWSAAHVFMFFDKNAKQKVTLPKRYGRGVDIKIVPSAVVLRNPRINYALKETTHIITMSIIYGALASLFSLGLIFVYLRRRGKTQSSEKKIRGYEIATGKESKKLVKKVGASDIKISDLPMTKDFETGHVLIHGTTGMGKSVCIKEFLDQIRARGDKAIIYDQGGDYIQSFYNSGDNKNDIILNPLDERTASWDLWKECRYSADYDSLAVALIQTSGEHSDQFWTNAARLAFSATAKKLHESDNCSIHRLVRILLVSKISFLEKFLSGTEAASLFDQSIDKTALSIRATLATYLKSLKYIKEGKDEKSGKEPFSIRKWIQNDNQNDWLFVSSRADSHETLKPLISMWLDLAVNSLLSLPASNKRRIWLIFDELASLHKLPYLPAAFAQARKFGGCIVAGIQSISQLRKVYGQNAANEISTMCNTRIFFRAPSSESALWTSKEIGQYEIEEMKEGISYSESAMRSGISIAKQRLQQDLVSPSEIMSLNSLEAYIRLPGKLPITKLKLKYKKRETENEAFVIRDVVAKDTEGKKDGDELIGDDESCSVKSELSNNNCPVDGDNEDNVSHTCDAKISDNIGVIQSNPNQLSLLKDDLEKENDRQR